MIAKDRGDFQVAGQYFKESLGIAREIGQRKDKTISLNNLGLIAQNRGDLEAAKHYSEESLAIKREISDRLGITYSLNTLGQVAVAIGDVQSAWRYYLDAMSEAIAINAIILALIALKEIAGLLAYSGRFEQAAELLGLAKYHPYTDEVTRTEHIEPSIAVLREKMPIDELESALKRGKVLNLETIVAKILAESK